MGAGFVQIVINTSIIILELITWKITVLNVDLECKKRGINKMDEPIISPWLIYLIGSVDGVLAWVIIIGLCSLAKAQQVITRKMKNLNGVEDLKFS